METLLIERNHLLIKDIRITKTGFSPQSISPEEIMKLILKEKLFIKRYINMGSKII
jgi:hypothetical protein